MRVRARFAGVALALAVGVGAVSSLGAASAPALPRASGAVSDLCLLGFIGCAPAADPPAGIPSASPSAPDDGAGTSSTPASTGTPADSSSSGSPSGSQPSGSPSGGAPTDSQSSGSPSGGSAPGSSTGVAAAGSTTSLADPTATPAPATQPPTVLAPADAGAMPLTSAPAKLSAATLAISGLKGLSVVTVTLPNGDTARHIKLEADHISIDGFRLDVSDAEGHGVLSTATNMTADGSVVVYLDSISGLLASGASAVFDALTPPTSVDDLLGLTTLTLDLYGLSGDTLTLTASHEALH